MLRRVPEDLSSNPYEAQRSEGQSDSKGPDFGEKPVAVKSLGASSVDLGFEPFAELFISGAFP